MIKLGLIGDPISHSLSPIIHTTVMNYLGIEHSYEPYNVKKGDLEGYIRKIKEENILGFNVTMPHKVDIIKYLDVLDDDSIKFNSVNTVKYESGKLYGYNTDARGLVMSLSDNSVNLAGKNILILGAGGVASTIAVKFAEERPNKIIVLNRSLDKAKEVCNLVSKQSNVTTIYDELKNVENYTKATNLVVNTTPLGMHGIEEDFENLDFLNNLNKSTIVCDLIYNPRETLLLQQAKLLNIKTLNGLGMLIYQALISDEIYLNQKIDYKMLYKIICEKI